MPQITDILGSRGEDLFRLAVTEYGNFAHPLFRPYFLGEISLGNELNSVNLQVLFNEVKAFWAASTYKPAQSAFA